MLGYLSADIICSEKRTVFRERRSRKTVSFVLKWRFRCSSLRSFFNNIHEKIFPRSLAESMSINPKQCKNLKFFEFRKTKLVQKVEIECKNLKLNWLIGKSRKRWPVKSFVFKSSAHALGGAIHDAIFPWLRDMRAFLLLNHENFFSCIYY